MIDVNIVYNSENELPKYQTPGSAGCDLMAELSKLTSENFKGNNAYLDHTTDGLEVVIRPGGTALIPTGMFTNIPEGYEVQVRSRSGLALKNSVLVSNSPGTIDSDYTSEWGVILINLGNKLFRIKQGDRIAQAVLNKVEQINWKVVDSLEETERKGGFGSTGVKSKSKKSKVTNEEAKGISVADEPVQSESGDNAEA